MIDNLSTPLALLDAAEAAFAEHGIDHASLRAIMRASGTNPAAVHYHYGSREALARAVLERVLNPLQARRVELLRGDLADRDQPSIEALLEALIRPDLEAAVWLSHRTPSGAALIGAIYTRPSAFVETLVEASFAPVATEFFPHFSAALPHLDPDELSWRIRWAVFGALGARLSDTEAITQANLEAELARLLTITIGALTAPPTKEPQP